MIIGWLIVLEGKQRGSGTEPLLLGFSVPDPFGKSALRVRRNALLPKSDPRRLLNWSRHLNSGGAAAAYN